MMEVAVAVAWWNPEQRKSFLDAWGIAAVPEWLFLQQDDQREGGAKTKNKAVIRAAWAGAETVVLLDDDCFPCTPGQSLEDFAAEHEKALRPQPVEMFQAVTEPPSRGTPYRERHLTVPVACSMGFWAEVGDYCAPRQLVYGATHPMTFAREPVFLRYFPLCGMNLAFRVNDWMPWCLHVEDVGRFDDIWMGFLWQKEAYRRGFCFNLAGPLVRHSRQSNVWKNLLDEVRLLEANESVWKSIHLAPPDSTYEVLRFLLPRPTEAH